MKDSLEFCDFEKIINVQSYGQIGQHTKFNQNLSTHLDCRGLYRQKILFQKSLFGLRQSENGHFRQNPTHMLFVFL